MDDDIHGLSHQDWSNIFSAPLNPSVFHALAANGVLGTPDALHHRPPAALPPSLWMSASHHTPAPPSHYQPRHDDLAPLSPASPTTDSKSSLFTDLFTDDLFPGPPLSPQPTSPFTSPRVSGSPVLNYSPDPSEIDPEQLAREDPLATQVWKMYARTKVTLPHAQRMENITWRMMALALKKKKEDEDAKLAADIPKLKLEPPADLMPPATVPSSDERGRRIDKGKAKVRVVGFEAINDSLNE